MVGEKGSRVCKASAQHGLKGAISFAIAVRIIQPCFPGLLDSLFLDASWLGIDGRSVAELFAPSLQPLRVGSVTEVSSSVEELALRFLRLNSLTVCIEIFYLNVKSKRFVNSFVHILHSSKASLECLDLDFRGNSWHMHSMPPARKMFCASGIEGSFLRKIISCTCNLVSLSIS